MQPHKKSPNHFRGLGIESSCDELVMVVLASGAVDVRVCSGAEAPDDHPQDAQTYHDGKNRIYKEPSGRYRNESADTHGDECQRVIAQMRILPPVRDVPMFIGDIVMDKDLLYGNEETYSRKEYNPSADLLGVNQTMHAFAYDPDGSN